MKNKFLKAFSVLLTLAVILSTCLCAVSVSAATQEKDYAIYFDNSTDNNFWVTKKNADIPHLGMEEMNLPTGNTYTVDFDVYALTAGSDVVLGATTATWETTSAIEGGHQVWGQKAPASLNTWTHYSFNVTTIAEWKGLIFYVTGDNFKGYIDNFTVKASDSTVVASFEPTKANVGLTSNCASVVELPAEVEYAKNPDYAMYIDDPGEAEAFWPNEMGCKDTTLVVGETYSVEFDFYATEFNGEKGELSLRLQNGLYGSTQVTDPQYMYHNITKKNEWVTYSKTVTATGTVATPLMYITQYVEGYFDNFTIKNNKGEVVYSFEPTAADLTKTSNCASIVALSRELHYAKNPDTAIYFDNSTNNNFWMTQKDASHLELGMEQLNLPAGNTYTVDFDVYALTAGSDVVLGATTATWETTSAIEGGHQVWKKAPTDLNTWAHYSFNVTTIAEWKGLIFYVTGDNFKGYIDNFTVKASDGTVVASFEPTKANIGLTSNCASIVGLSEQISLEKNIDYSMLVDTTTVATDGSANKAFWFNELGMAKYKLTEGEYTIAFDVYPLEFPLTQNVFHFRTSSGEKDTWGGFWKATDLVKNQWNTTTTKLIVDDPAKTGNHILYVYGGFKGYVDNVRIIDSQGKVVVGTNHNINGLSVPDKHAEYLTIAPMSDEIVEAKEPCIHVYKFTTQDSTCVDPGFTKHICSLCGNEENVQPIDIKVHSYENYVSNNDATCTANGTETGTCVCGKTDTRVVADSKLDHTYENYVSNNDATCTANGTETGTCVCGLTDTRVVADSKLDHTYENYVSNNDATCTANGTETGTCVCGLTDTRVVADSKLDHTYENYVSNNDATCTANGTETGTCVCGKTDTRVVADSKKGHTYDKSVASSTYLKSKATCTAKAVYYKSCVCGAKGTDTFTSGSVLAHTKDSGTITKKATCTATGTKTFKCTVCKTLLKNETIAKVAHKYVSKVTKATTSNDGKSYKECSVCKNDTSESKIYKIKTVKLSTTKYTYNGKTKKPTITVKDSKGKTISSKYYTVSGTRSSKSVGKHTMTIKFKDKYSGSVKLSFTINPDKSSVKKLTAAKKSLKVSLKKGSGASGFEIEYSTSKLFKSSKKKTTTKTSYTIKSLKAKKTYYVRVRSYKTVGGKKYYSDWSKAISKKTK